MEDSDAHLDVFPEYAMGVPPEGLNKEYIQKNAEPLDGEFVTKILEKTSQKQSSAVFTMFLREGSVVYNAAILAETGRIKAVYKKIHLFDAFGYRESELFAPGKEMATTEFKGFQVGLAVCFDLRFPELFRQMAYRGVSLFIVPSAWYLGKHKLEQWRILVKARAHENTSFLVAINQTKPFFIGHSMGASPFGYAIQELGEGQTSFFIELDRKEIENAQKLVPTIELSKPELYKAFNMQC
ncbi:MAG: nitrilase [Candidatus Bathyarchaeota archaeon]|nr:MAG: nitrilase [Candidatus Bathyarchaeota archaeon]